MKLRPQDAATIFDPEANAQPIAFALHRAQFVERSELQPLQSRLRELLAHHDAEVRGEAAKVLLVGLDSAADVDQVLELLRKDRDPYWVARAAASLALSSFAAAHANRRHDVLQALAHTIKTDPEWGVQLAAYQDFLRLVSPSTTFDAGDEVFDADEMVDWELVGPYLVAAN